ncbi:MAG: ECF-type riboflavin transporter substrate-binding protein [Spirochaetaceae bacterium]|jgi:energy-coupling factor transport system substrate-specific component|nr:ECF-type riboflavin transporter substrate-binding protein [Spirochaetaceae bacterium]
MENKIISVKTVVAVGIGAALMFVLMRFVAIPSGIPNTNLNLGIPILVLFATVFGPVAGLLIGFIGHTLTDLTFGFGIWWSWVIADAVLGLLVGLFWKLYRIEDGEFSIKNAVVFNVVQILSNAVAWIGVAPVLDILIHKEPANKVFTQGIVAALLNAAAVLVLGTLLVIGYSKTKTKTASLSAE